jgi:hypothetical protein
MKSIYCFVLGFVFFVATLVPGFAADPKVGDTVAAKWTDGGFYVGTVTGLAADGANVLYEDGDKRTVPLAELAVLSKDTVFKTGDHVIAAWKGAKMFPGVVTAVTDATCTVKWDDGDAPIDVAKGRMALLAK